LLSLVTIVALFLTASVLELLVPYTVRNGAAPSAVGVFFLMVAWTHAWGGGQWTEQWGKGNEGVCDELQQQRIIKTPIAWTFLLMVTRTPGGGGGSGKQSSGGKNTRCLCCIATAVHANTAYTIRPAMVATYNGTLVLSQVAIVARHHHTCFQRTRCAEATRLSRCRLGHHQTRPIQLPKASGAWAGYGRNTTIVAHCIESTH
jgi:hypothetical protein